MRVKVSNELLIELKKVKKKTIVSFLPNDKRGCDCFGLVRDWMGKMNDIKFQGVKEAIGIIDCPSILGKKKFEIRCSQCGDLVGYIHASDQSLRDWCNLHYVSEARLVKKKGKVYGEWHGCMSLQISPRDEQLGFECACGNDTRDFRISNNLRGKELDAKIKVNMIGRKFNENNSKFILKEIK